MIHWPTWRPPGGAATGMPATRSSASTSSGPSIHGIGVPTRANANRPRTRRSRVPRANSTAARPLHLPMQKREKMTPSRSSAVNSPVIAASAFCASRSSSATSSSGGRARREMRGCGARGARPRRASAPRWRSRARNVSFHVLVRAGEREHLAAQQSRRPRRSSPTARRAASRAVVRRRRRLRRAARPDRSCCARRCAAARTAAARASPHRPRRASPRRLSRRP